MQSSRLTSPPELRIALILAELRPGGMERVVVHLAKELAARKIPVLVICLQNPGLLASEFEGTKVNLVAINSFSGKDLGAVWRLRQKIAGFQPTVINLHDYASLPYAVAANALAGRSLVCFTAHGLLYEGFENRRARNRIFVRFITGFSAVSNKVASRHREYLGWNRPIEIIANGVPAASQVDDDRVQTRAQLGCQPGEVLLLAIGNPRPEKGFEDLIDAVALLPADKNFSLAVAGALNDSDYCRMLLRRVEERQLKNRIRFLGFCQDTGSLYAAGDAFVLSSRSEGLPMVILEAMMAGLPVVATRVGGIPDAVGEHVLLVDPAHPEQLAQAMDQLINDQTLRYELAVKGQAYVEKQFGVERMVDGYVSWYRKVLSSEC